jgi:CBS-domain-containing membrane protein
MLPILNPEDKVIGVVTDRDLCIALGTRNRLAGEIAVWDVASGKVFSCNPEDDIHTALAKMAKSKVRRLPVINTAGKLEGILSMDDVVLHSESKVSGKTPGLSYDDVVDTLKKLYRPELPEVTRQKTAAA